MITETTSIDDPVSTREDREAILIRERRRFVFRICAEAECGIRTAEKVLSDQRGAEAMQSVRLRSIMRPLVTEWRRREAAILNGVSNGERVVK